MNKIREFVGRIRSWVRTDGLLHIETSAIIAVAGLGLFGWLAGILITVVIGVAKEIYDRVSGKGTAEWHDVICDAIGLAVGLVLNTLPWW